MEEENRFIDRPLRVKVPKRMHEQLKKIATKNGQTLAAQVRFFIAEGLRKNEEESNSQLVIPEEEYGGKKDAQ